MQRLQSLVDTLLDLVLIKSQQYRAVRTILDAATPEGVSHRQWISSSFEQVA